ncbi:MAG TPA: hypothetical protein VJY41_07120 [Prolixibacteraceae bacterium]|nr:hypothetical protein [Prolixibacteraceae bacterium]
MTRKTIILLFTVMLFAACENNNVVKINIDKVVTQNFIGNGVQWDPYPHADSHSADWGLLMTDEKWQMVFNRLDYMQPRLVRVVDQANWRYLHGFDNKGNPILDFNSPEEKALEKLLNYCQRKNITVMLGEWGTPYAVHDTKAGFSDVLTGANDSRWIEMIVKHLDYLITQKGFTCIRYFNLVNEPNGYWASTNGNWDEWSEGVSMLANVILEAKLDKYVTIAGPDAVAHYNHPNGLYTGMQWVEQAAKQLNNELGALEIHAYFDQSVIREARFDSIYKPLVEIARSIEKPILFGEVGFEKNTPENQARVETDPHASPDSYMAVYDFQHGLDMADAAIQIMNTGFQGAAAWALDDAMHTQDDSGDKNKLKRWGMWNILGTEICNNPADENIRPWFFTWSLMCRYIKPGSQVVETSSLNTTGLRFVFTYNENDFTLAAVNQLNIKQSIDVEMPENFRHQQIQFFNYRKNNFKTNENGFPLAENNVKIGQSGRIKLVLPPKTFQLITTYTY